jgi:hypothetical protein
MPGSGTHRETPRTDWRKAMISSQTCYTVSCDGCGDISDGGDYVLHFDSEREAIAHMVEECGRWEERAGKLYCEDCQDAHAKEASDEASD